MGGGTQQAPTPYQPANQAGADAGFQQGTNQLATAGSQLYSTVAPQLQQISQNVQSNPYYQQAQQGAGNAANLATTQVAPQQFAGAQQDTQLGGLAALGGIQGYNQAQSLIPGTTQPELQAGRQVLNTAFDPQRALYNQQQQQNQDQGNAINAQNGVAGSPFGAGLSAQNNQNFNLNWQNQQLGRQTQGLSAYDSAATTAAGNMATLTNAGSGALNAGINTATGANAAASDLGTAGLNTVAGAAQLPQEVYLQQQQAALAALGAQVQGTNASQAMTQQGVADQGAYLNIGQTASQGATNAAQVNNQASAAAAAGFGNLFGDITGMFSFGGGGSSPFAALAGA
jgi:hypothetical protein